MHCHCLQAVQSRIDSWAAETFGQHAVPLVPVQYFGGKVNITTRLRPQGISVQPHTSLTATFSSQVAAAGRTFCMADHEHQETYPLLPPLSGWPKLPQVGPRLIAGSEVSVHRVAELSEGHCKWLWVRICIILF
jgi:hypothetical protein